MTNKLSLAEVLDQVVEIASNHIRITTALAEGKNELASNLIDLRVCAYFDDFAKGDMKGDPLDYYLGLALECPGPLLFRGIKEAVQRFIQVGPKA